MFLLFFAFPQNGVRYIAINGDFDSTEQRQQRLRGNQKLVQRVLRALYQPQNPGRAKGQGRTRCAADNS
jgi:hypothetical protein